MVETPLGSAGQPSSGREASSHQQLENKAIWYPARAQGGHVGDTQRGKRHILAQESISNSLNARCKPSNCTGAAQVTSGSPYLNVACASPGAFHQYLLAEFILHLSLPLFLCVPSDKAELLCTPRAQRSLATTQSCRRRAAARPLLLGAHLLHLASGRTGERGQLPRLPATPTAACHPATRLPPTSVSQPKPPSPVHRPRPRQCPQSSRLLPMQLLWALATCPGAAGAGRAPGDNGARGSGSAPESLRGKNKLLLHLSADHLWMSERSCVCTARLSLSPQRQWSATLPQARWHPSPLLLCPRASPLKKSR